MAQSQLLLTAAPDVQEWASLIEAIECEIGGGWVADNLQNIMRETYKEIRSRGGYVRRVTHFTEDCAQDSAEVSSTLHLHLDEIVGDCIGNGHFSTVFECPWDCDKVIKVGYGPGGNGEIYDDGWLIYAAYCIDKQKQGYYNPILPIVHKLYIGECHNFFVALLERYDDEWEVAERFASADAHKQYLALKQGIRGQYNADACPVYKQYMSQLNSDHDFPRVDDMHDGNVMLKDDRVVLTDPVGLGRHDYRIVQQRLRHLGILPEDPEADAALVKKKKQDRLNEYANKLNRRHWATQTIAVDANGVATVQADDFADNIINAANAWRVNAA